VAQIIAGVEKLIQPALQEFVQGTSRPAVTEDAQDESPYVGTLRRILQEAVLQCSAVLHSQILRFLLDKIATNIVPKYTAHLFKLKKLNDFTISQVRIDCVSLEKMFAALPNHGNPDRFPVSMIANYAKLIRREFDRMNRALKVLQCEPTGESFVDVYYELTLPEDRSIQHFTKLVELKEHNRNEMKVWITRLAQKGVAECTKKEKCAISREPSATLLPVQSLTDGAGSPGAGEKSFSVAARLGKVVRSATNATSLIANLRAAGSGSGTK
jgi:hypothetical protein